MMSKNKKTNISSCFSEKGFTLLEMLFTIFILTVGIVGIYGAIVRSLSQSSDISERLKASYLAEEGIEIVRSIREANWLNAAPWDDGIDSCSSGCELDYRDLVLSPYGARFLYINHDSGFYEYINIPSEDDIKTKFKRKVTIEDIQPAMPGGPGMDVKVEVFWDDNAFSVQEKLYHWK